MSLFDGIRRKAKIDATNTKSPVEVLSGTSMSEEKETPSEGYYFENPYELAAYGKKHGKDNTIYWLSGDKYINEFRKGYKLFEQRQYARAINAYEKCLVYNPVGLSARFEICEANLQLHNLPAAKQALLEMKDYLLEEKNIARFYRRMGYIEIEAHKYETAIACYLYSREFENHPSVAQELQFIQSKGGMRKSIEDPVKILEIAGIPVLTVPAPQ